MCRQVGENLVTVVVVGYGMAGARVVADLRARDPHRDVVVLGAEPHAAYNRILLSNLVAGKARERDVTLTAAQGRGVDVRLGVAAAAIDRAARTVTTSDGGEVAYDHLILATGARAALPPIKGLVDDDGALAHRVVAFRTLDDCRRIIALAQDARRAIVLGGGLLGLEAARGLAARGIEATVLHAVGGLMERQLDAGASAVLVSTLNSLGVGVELDATTVAVDARADGVDVRLGDGRCLSADLVVVACGVRPEIGLAERAGLRVERGVVVNDRLRTSDAAISAIGDCAQHAGVVTGLVAPAWEQARVLAGVITGAAPLDRYRPQSLVTRLKATGIDLAAMGDSTSDSGEQVTFADPARGTYAKLVVRDNRLAGAILLGDNPTVGAVIQLFDRGARLPADLRGLLLGRPSGTGADHSTEASPALMPDAAVVCHCNGVTKRALVGCWRDGGRTVAEAAASTRASTGCGGCRDAVEGILGWLRMTEGVAA
jgi:assimilatory nitrate reductase electron transfer subunit